MIKGINCDYRYKMRIKNKYLKFFVIIQFYSEQNKYILYIE